LGQYRESASFTSHNILYDWQYIRWRHNWSSVQLLVIDFIQNSQVMCRWCNGDKSDRVTLLDMLAGRGGRSW
jgi:hypothetical protein